MNIFAYLLMSANFGQTLTSMKSQMWTEINEYNSVRISRRAVIEIRIFMHLSIRLYNIIRCENLFLSTRNNSSIESLQHNIIHS
jgi:hypothetical protein